MWMMLLQMMEILLPKINNFFVNAGNVLAKSIPPTDLKKKVDFL